MMLNIHVYPSPLTHESRILRITEAIAELEIFEQIDIVGVAANCLPYQEVIDSRRRYIRLPRNLAADRDGLVAKIIKSLEWSLRVLIRYRKQQVACVNAHSLAVLPLCWVLSVLTRARLVYDTHELETETSGNKGVRQKLAKFVERIFVKRADFIFVVSDSIRDWYVNRYNIKAPTTVRNIPIVDQAPMSDIPKEISALPIPQTAVKFIYQGGFISGRGIELLLETFAASPSAHLILMGSGPLIGAVQTASKCYENIHLLPAVPPNQVLKYTRSADIGVCLTDNSCLSHFFSLPNKVFEYLQAGLPILVNPLLEQQKIVRQYQCGWVAPEDRHELQALLRQLDTKAIAAARKGVERAKTDLNWSKEKLLIASAYRELFA